jgi:mono/diheme cytochrome c family protein
MKPCNSPLHATPDRPAALRAALTALPLLVGVIGLSPLAVAAEVDAHALVEKNCTSCHGSEMYTRADRKIDSLSALETQVEACNTNLNTGMFPEEVNAVATLLNAQYYKFGD